MRKTLLALVLVSSIGCAGLLPFQGSVDVQRTAAQISDGLTVAFVALDEAGKAVDALAIAASKKDVLDCGILSVVGHDTPSATVVNVCGPITVKALAPAGKALAALRTATSKPGLCGTVTAILDVLQPLLARLEAAGTSVTVMRAALTFTLKFAGGCV